MKHIIGLYIVCVFSMQSAGAEPEKTLPRPIPIRALKQVNSKALIIIPKSITLTPGKKYVLSEVGTTQTGKEEEVPVESKHHSLGMNFDASILTEKNSTQALPINLQNFSFNFLYGWNWEYVEAGPFLEYTFTKTNSISVQDTKTIYPGVFLDLNFSPNTVSATNVFGLRVIATYANEDNSLYASAGVGTRYQGGLVYKWFGLSTSLAVVAQAAYEMESLKWSDATITRNGFVGNIGVQTYF